MKAFVAGATGVLGRRSVARLVAAGIELTGAARSDRNEDLLLRLGAAPLRVGLFDRDALVGAVSGHDVVLNLARPCPVANGRPAGRAGRTTTASAARPRTTWSTRRSRWARRAGAAVAALRAPGGTYNVVDDRPLRRSEFVAALTTAFGMAPLALPDGPDLPREVAFLMRSQRVANDAFRAATGWSPGSPSAWEGWRAVAGDLGEAPHRRPAG